MDEMQGKVLWLLGISGELGAIQCLDQHLLKSQGAVSWRTNCSITETGHLFSRCLAWHAIGLGLGATGDLNN